VYKLNKTGARTDPCGTPKGRRLGQDSEPNMLNLLSVRHIYELNNWRVVKNSQHVCVRDGK